jgi:DNA-binding CsgD family transcriptional regulator
MGEFDERLATNGDLAHYGTPRRSGRYPWGSGQSPMQSGRSFLGYVENLRSQGLSEAEIAKGLGISTTDLRARRAISKAEKRQSDAAEALRLHDKGMSNVAIGRRMGINESSVRSLLNPALAAKRGILESTSSLLKQKVDEGGYLDIGSGTENHLGISATKLSTAVAMLKAQGYVVHNVQVAQQFGGGKTTIKVLAPPGTKYVDIVRNPERIKTVAAYSEDGGRTYQHIQPPVSVSASRIGVRHAEQGGGNADGVIYVRPGVPDVSLGSAKYAQVRIAVDKNHYLKGMAMYKDDLPAGIDLLFNTSKHDTGNKFDALKISKDDELNPFGSVIRQRHYTDSQGRRRLSPMNIVNEEGNWRDWRPSLSSQVLSKQSIALARRQLDFALASKRDELDEILSLTNPVVRRKLLETFGDEADSAAVHLKAAALPRQGTHVILPLEGIKSNEIYAPNYRNGETVALIRHPHGGIFEIPELRVNNRNVSGRSALGDAKDAVGIHPSVSRRLSGADFDGDAVLVIPNSRRTLKTAAPLAGLKDFDARTAYPGYPGMKVMSPHAKQQHMGDVSNLITDMTIKGARPDELARAVRHSMVVIDAEKHGLNYRQSYIDNGIAALKEKYQGRGKTGRLAGASTIISRAGSELRVPERRPRPAAKGGPIDRETGRRVYEPTGATYVDRRGKTIIKTIRSTKLAEAFDARSLSSGSPMEEVYAAHSNSLKGLANRARYEAVRTGMLRYSPSAHRTYAKEVSSLLAKLNLAYKNRPRERQAQLIASMIVAAKTRDNPGMDSDTLRKVKAQALNAARDRVGARKPLIDITPREWEAIQAGAISTNRLNEILNNSDLDRIKVLATPRRATVMTPARMAIARSRLASGYTRAEVAASLGISVSTLNSALLNDGR